MDEQEPQGRLNVSDERLEEIKKKLAAGEHIDLTPDEVANIEQQTGEEIADPYGDIADLPIAYDDAGVEELDPAMLAAAYAQAAQKRSAQIKAMMRASGRGSVYTKKAYDKDKARKRNKLAKNSRKKNRKR